MKKYIPALLFFAVLSFALQSCLGFSPFHNKATGKHGGININTDEASFKGKIYLTLNRNLYMLDEQKNLTQLTKGLDARDPAVSPDGKKIAFVIRYKNYSDLAFIPASGGQPTVLLSGNGAYVPNYPFDTPKSTYHWFAQPAWASDSQHLLFLSDLEKFYPRTIGVDSFLLDLMAFSIDVNHPDPATAQEVAYPTYGDGGLRDPAYRPGHPDQVVYTSYSYDKTTQTQQVIQINLEDPNAIKNDAINHPYNRFYTPGTSQIESDPGVALTPDNPVPIANMQPSFSPDGNTLAYVRRVDATHMSLYTMPVANGVTATANPNAKANLEAGLAPYSQSTLLLTKQYLGQPIWSPDGSQIAFYDYNNNTFDLWLLNLTPTKNHTYTIKQDTTPIQLTDAHGDLDADSHSCWTQ